jgi:hypothetical protein
MPKPKPTPAPPPPCCRCNGDPGAMQFMHKGRMQYVPRRCLTCGAEGTSKGTRPPAFGTATDPGEAPAFTPDPRD